MSSVSAIVKFLKRTSIAAPGARLFGCDVEGSEFGCLSRRNENPPAMRMPPEPSSGAVCAAAGGGGGGTWAAAGADRIRRRNTPTNARRADNEVKGSNDIAFQTTGRGRRPSQTKKR